MEKKTVVIKVNDIAYIGYPADDFIDLEDSNGFTQDSNNGETIQTSQDYVNADEVRF